MLCKEKVCRVSVQLLIQIWGSFPVNSVTIKKLIFYKVNCPFHIQRRETQNPIVCVFFSWIRKCLRIILRGRIEIPKWWFGVLCWWTIKWTLRWCSYTLCAELCDEIASGVCVCDTGHRWNCGYSGDGNCLV